MLAGFGLRPAWWVIRLVSFGVPQEHNGFARVAWVTRFGTGQPSLAGDDFAQLAADGRIVLLVSFDGTAESPR